MSEKKPPVVSAVLPPQARSALIAAVNIDTGVPRTESQERTNALDYAIRNIRTKFPSFFKEK